MGQNPRGPATLGVPTCQGKSQRDSALWVSEVMKIQLKTRSKRTFHLRNFPEEGSRRK